MIGVRPFLSGAAIVILAILIVLGSLSQSLLEGTLPSLTPTATLVNTSIFETTLLPSLPTSTTPLPRPTVTETPRPDPNPGEPQTINRNCLPPDNWVAYTVQIGDSVYQLSRTVGVSSAEILAANCLRTPDLQPDQVLYLPRDPAAEDE